MSCGLTPSDEGTAEAIFEASGGIPRRINSVCDRLLLLGFLANKTHLGVDDVAQVVRDFADDAPAPVRRQGAGGPNGSALDLETSGLRLDASAAGDLSDALTDLAGDQHHDRLQRIEHGLLRLERVNLQTLALMQQLVDALRKSSDEGAP